MRLIAFVLVFWATGLCAQEDFFSAVVDPDTTAERTNDSLSLFGLNIRAEEIMRHVYHLASDSLEGRELGSVGNARAGDYIARHFADRGLETLPGLDSGYFQGVRLRWMYWDKLQMKISGVAYKQLWDYLSIPSENADLDLRTSEVVFLGYGIDDQRYSDYRGVDVRDKVILIYKGEPRNKSGRYWITGTDSSSAWSVDLSRKVEAARSRGVRLVLVIEDRFKHFVDEKRSLVISPQVFLGAEDTESIRGTNVAYLSSTTTAMLLGKSQRKVIAKRKKINRSGKPQHHVFAVEFEVQQKLRIRKESGRNVIGIVRGQLYPDEAVVLSAHYDHIGMRGKEVFNGADDNASGTASLMEIAGTVAEMAEKGVRPKRTLVFALMTGEEKGLLGSLYYVHNPLVPLNKTMANVNVDMIGRTDDKYGTDTQYVYVIGSDRISPDLHALNLDINQRYSRLRQDHSYNAEAEPNRFYYRSDHYNFAERGVPSIFFFSGVHEDYHRITDDPEKVRFGKTALIARHIFYLAWALANRVEPLRR
ncbi:MAG: M28 family peptidase [Saprospiraceae bacterium]|jgi:hypothetical protein|nr:M28 family peptidase [Saprospiraceae bacterium]MBP9209369.1 M28 family peptidase [Saprospiraceae bacterium]MBV6474223.1 hypothetical protein [Saprospiraceae bacterium]